MSNRTEEICLICILVAIIGAIIVEFFGSYSTENVRAAAEVIATTGLY